MQLSFIWTHLGYSHFFSDVGRPSSVEKWHNPDTWNGKKFSNLMSNTVFFCFPLEFARLRWSLKKVSCSKTQNSFFADHFRFQAKSELLLMKITPLVPHVFSSFLFYQELRPFKNYRTFRFKFPDKKLISLRQFTIPPSNAGGFSKFAPSVFFEYGVRLRSR